jgi:tetraacyldisaccharide 4'-kinase
LIVREALQRAWTGRGALACLLWPLSQCFGGLAALRRWLYRRQWLRSESVGVPVLVVGNVVAGGAGKTPVVIALVEHFTQRGIAVGVVSRGHGRSSVGLVQVHPDSEPQLVGDEPLLIARRTRVPVWVGERRVEAARALLAAHPHIRLILSDDGLQHYAMKRDFELCVFDDSGTANGWLLPAGPLRERWPRPANLVLRTEGTPGIEGHVLRRRLATHAARSDGTRVELASLRGTACHAVAGIAQPQRFFDMLRAAGLRLQSTLALPDHHDFASTPLPPAEAGPLLCTEKDAVKLMRIAPQAMAVPLEVEIDPPFWAALDALVLPKLSSPDGSQTP